MTRLALAIGLSAGAHAAFLIALPSGRGGRAGWGGPDLPATASLREVRILPPRAPGHEGEPSAGGPPALHAPPERRTPEGDPLPPSEAPDRGVLDEAAFDLDAWRIQAGPAAPPAAPPSGRIPLPPPVPAFDRIPVRLEDFRWNRQVDVRIGAKIQLSEALRKADLHGSVRLVLYLHPDGRIRDLRVADPGPYPALTIAAQAQVRAAAPFPPPPAGMDPRLLRIPVNLHF